ncbi:MAG: type II toxin-antitoxin system HipA family toxin [Candidatus Moranbacteria bacterium]|nr:type II toxin-antitoxin system HipA family toxin [Candidatus Moranbacteria bacterium]
MEAKRCLYCYQFLNKEEHDIHAACSKKFFGSSQPPLLPYSEAEMYELGLHVIRSQSAVTGVQPKLSLHLEKPKDRETPRRFTIVGLWGSYILKPPVDLYPNLPELEDLTMHLAENCGIKTVPHSLIRLGSGSLAYITKRIDRTKAQKIHMEDMCQLTGRLTEHKYKGSYEQIAKAILKHSANPLFDVISFFEQVVFSFLTGNADMHLKNFSLMKHPNIGWVLCPAYDMVPSALVVKGDSEELALNINGKKQKINNNDFRTAMKKCHIPDKAMENIFSKFKRIDANWDKLIHTSFLPEDLKEDYSRLISLRMNRLYS